MDILKKYWPHAFKATELNNLIITLIIYILVDVVCGVVISLLAKLPIVGVLFGVIGTLVGIYALAGIVLAILIFAKVLK